MPTGGKGFQAVCRLASVANRDIEPLDFRFPSGVMNGRNGGSLPTVLDRLIKTGSGRSEALGDNGPEGSKPSVLARGFVSSERLLIR